MKERRIRKDRPIVRRIKNFIRVPIVGQDTNYTCGVAALQSVLYYWDESEDYFASRLAKRLKANIDDGVVSGQIEAFAKSRGFKVVIREKIQLNELKKYLKNGKPIIILLQAWRKSSAVKWSGWNEGHFAVAIGYDKENIYFMDPSTTGNYTFIPINEFMKRWHDRDGRSKVHQLGIIIWKGKPYFDDRIAVKMQ
jgi:predicted double-glycine peptidase